MNMEHLTCKYPIRQCCKCCLWVYQCFHSSKGTEFSFQHWFESDVLFNSPGAYTKLLFPLQRLNDCVNVKSKLNKDVGEPPPWGYPQRTPPRPPCAWFPQSPVRSHGAERSCRQTAAHCQLAEAWLHNLPKLLSVCLRERGPCNKSTADPLTNVSWIQFRRSWEGGLYS